MTVGHIHRVYLQIILDGDHHMIVSEYMELGSLKDFLINQPEGALSQQQKLSICYQVKTTSR